MRERFNERFAQLFQLALINTFIDEMSRFEETIYVGFAMIVHGATGQDTSVDPENVWMNQIRIL